MDTRRPSSFFILFTLLGLVLILPSLRALDNGLARRPPMGWLSWARYVCNVDCDLYPNECIHERLYREMADRLATEGFLAAGYQYVNVDDCWAEMDRDPLTNELIPDRKRFPNGIRALADYAHSRGLNLGIYGDVGRKTCMGYPGSGDESGTTTANDYYMIDSITFASWRVDSLKMDGCYADVGAMDEMYPRMGSSMNMTGRHMLYSCSWPAYQVDSKMHPNYTAIAAACNLWRNFDDIENSWQSVSGVIDFYGAHADEFAATNGPGQWFDPDMLVIGNDGLTVEQARAQMALWCIWSAPLYMSNDLRRLGREFKEILLNRRVIAINQDPLGRMATRRIWPRNKDVEIWAKQVMPLAVNDPTEATSVAVVYLNRRTLGGPLIVDYPLAEILSLATNSSKPTRERMYYAEDLFDESQSGLLGFDDNLTLTVRPSGAVRMIKITPLEFIARGPGAEAAAADINKNNLQ